MSIKNRRGSINILDTYFASSINFGPSVLLRNISEIDITGRCSDNDLCYVTHYVTNFYLCSLCYMCICMHQVCLSMMHSFRTDC